MRAQKDENGFMSAEQQNHRFINVLQLLYLSAEKNSSGSGYIIPENIMSKVETELDFNTNEKIKSKIISEQIKKYRKRKSYAFWFNILHKGNYSKYDEARSVLMEISNKMVQDSMTHFRYSMETLHLALDDYFGTNKVIITPSRFLTRKNKKNNNNKVKCGSQSPKKSSTKKSAITKKSNLSYLPF